jgi:predicted nucleotidyltransferase
MTLPPERLRALGEWAEANGNIRQIWMFGSLARGEAREGSEADLALALMPPDRAHNWAAGNYWACDSEWKEQLQAIVGRDVSIEPLIPGGQVDVIVRREGLLLWAREE